MPGRRAVHTKKFDRCVREVRRRGGAANPYAVCSAELGERGSVKKRHRRNPRRRVSTKRMPPALARYWRARNRRLKAAPKRARRHHRNASGFVIEARRGDSHLFYNGAGKFEGRNRARVYHNAPDAEATVYLLREGFPNALKGWELTVSPA